MKSATWVMVMTYTFDRRYIHIVKVSFRLYIRKKNSQFSKQEKLHLAYNTTLFKTEQSVPLVNINNMKSLDDLCIPKSPRTWHQQRRNSLLTILFCLNFHKHIFTIGQEQVSLLNYCLSTQRRPHARPHTMPCALLSDTNNNPFYPKQ